ncbi:MAG: DUF4331 domain-containing protein [Opitutaceae bacterium]
MNARRNAAATRCCATLLSGAAMLAALCLLPTAHASSHSDAPLIKQDPQANLTDVYAFIGAKYNDPSVKVLNVIVSLHPFCDPGDGVIYDRFSDDAQYRIMIADPVTGADLLNYDFFFSTHNPTFQFGIKNPDTILSYGLGTEVGPIVTAGDARQNFTQAYTVFSRGAVLGNDLTAPPPNVGANTTPGYNDASGVAKSGAATAAGLDSYTQQTVYELPSGEVVFAGARDDGFYADTPAIFDLLDSRILDNNGSLADGLGQDGGGVDGFKGYNVLVYAIQIPVEKLPVRDYADPFFGPAKGIGVYASVGRRAMTLRDENGTTSSGPFVSVNRLANPLFNEVLVALKDKDRYNRTFPSRDAVNFAKYAETPELATLINTVFSTSFVTTGRADLKAVYIPDVIRVNTETGPVPLPGQPGHNRLGFIGGDITDGFSSGWPNGRRIGDDVVDIALTAIASGPAYSSITVVGDNVAANDMPYNQVFPYLATPHAGPTVSQRQAP